MKWLFALPVLLVLLMGIMPVFGAVLITNPLTLNPGFENDSCPKDQDHLTCGWLINTQDCTFTAVCGNIVSALSPEGSRMLSLNGTSGQGQQNNDILSNVTGTIANTPALEFFVRWNSVTSCQGTRNTCLFKLDFNFNANTKTANFYWANNATVFAGQFVNSSSTVFISLNPVCGALVVSASFCHYYNPNFMAQLQTYFSNGLTTYGFGQGTGTQHGITINYSLDLSFGCFVNSPNVCAAAAWGLNVDYVVAGNSITIGSTINSNLATGATMMPVLMVVFFGFMGIVVIGDSTTRGIKFAKDNLPYLIGMAIMFLVFAGSTGGIP